MLHFFFFLNEGFPYLTNKNHYHHSQIPSHFFYICLAAVISYARRYEEQFMSPDIFATSYYRPVPISSGVTAVTRHSRYLPLVMRIVSLETSTARVLSQSRSLNIIFKSIREFLKESISSWQKREVLLNDCWETGSGILTRRASKMICSRHWYSGRTLHSLKSLTYSTDGGRSRDIIWYIDHRYQNWFLHQILLSFESLNLIFTLI